MPAINTQLGECHVCKNTVSKTAKTCPHCGQAKPIKPPPTSLKVKILVFCSLFAIIAPPILSNQTPAVEKQVVPQSAHDRCINAIKSSVNNPSTLDIHMITGYAGQVLGDGTIIITQTFSAKNAFGLEKTLDARCLISPKGKLKFDIVEQGR